MKKFIPLFCLLCLLSLTGNAFAYSVILSPNSQTIQVGDTTLLDVNLSLSPGEELFGFNLALAFDPNVLQFSNLLFGGQIANDYVAGFTAPSAGNDNIVTFDAGLAAQAGASSDLTLASLFFTGIGTGTSTLDLYGSVLDFNIADLTAVSDIGSIDVTSAPGPAPVPEPATCLLLGSALVGMFGLRRKLQRG